jgi:uncharacterized protein YggE
MSAVLGSPESPVVVVEATGVFPVVADTAIATLGVAAEDDEPGAALANCSDRLARVMDLLHAAGGVSDLATRSIEVHRRDQSSGYSASSWISAAVRPPDELGAVLSEALEGAGGGVIVRHVGLESSDTSAARAQARQQAVAEARRAARQLAEAAGADLGPIVSLVEAGAGAAAGTAAVVCMRAGAGMGAIAGIGAGAGMGAVAGAASQPMAWTAGPSLPGEMPGLRATVTVVATFQLLGRPVGPGRRT